MDNGMIRNETRDFASGAVLTAEVIDLAAGTYTREEHGVVTLVRDLTADEIAAYTPAPDPRATLLAEVQAATTVAKLRAAVLAAIEQGAL